MPTELQRRKFEKAFDRFDVDHDGALKQDDISAMSAAWLDVYNVKPESAEGNRLHTLAAKLWQDVLAATDTDHDQIVSKDEWNAALERPDFVDRVAVPFALAVFDVADRDSDGKLSVDEMIAAHQRAGIKEDESRKAFKALDTDNDGVVRRADFAAAIKEFYLSDDPNAAGNLLVGSL